MFSRSTKLCFRSGGPEFLARGLKCTLLLIITPEMEGGFKKGGEDEKVPCIHAVENKISVLAFLCHSYVVTM